MKQRWRQLADICATLASPDEGKKSVADQQLSAGIDPLPIVIHRWG